MQVSNNSPSPGYIAWTGVSISYKGDVFNIADGSTNYKFIYWLYSDPLNFYGSNAYPTLGDDDILVFLNKNGVHATVPNTTIIDGSLIVPESILSDQIAANAITTYELASGAVTTDKIFAGAVTANTIAAGAIGAAAIAAGAISADKLVSHSPNLMSGGMDTFDQLDTITGRGLTYGFTTCVLSTDDSVTGNFSLKTTTAATAGSPYKYLHPTLNSSNGWIDVVVGQRYTISAYVRGVLASSNVQLVGVWRDANNASVGTFTYSGNVSMAWTRIYVSGIAPVGAVTLSLYIKSTTNSATHYWDAFQVEQCSDPASSGYPSDWTPAGTTVINGGNIIARTITANAIAANTITATSGIFAAGAIQTAWIGDAQITAAKMGTLAVGTAAIQDGAITNVKIGSMAVDTAQIKDGAITNVKIADATIDNAKIANIDASKITTGTLTAITISGVTITGSTLRSSNTSDYVQIDNQFVRIYKGDTQKMFFGHYVRPDSVVQPTIIMGDDANNDNFVDGVWTMGWHPEQSGSITMGIKKGPSVAGQYDYVEGVSVYHYPTTIYQTGDGKTSVKSDVYNTLWAGSANNFMADDTVNGHHSFFFGTNPSTMDIFQSKLNFYGDMNIKGTARVYNDTREIKMIPTGFVTNNAIDFSFPGSARFIQFGSFVGYLGLTTNWTQFLLADDNYASPGAKIQRWDGANAYLYVGSTYYNSDRGIKKNVANYSKSALKEITTTPIREYQFNEETDNVDYPHVGVILQESPLDIVDPRGKGVDGYAMVAMAWKAIQELDEKITALTNGRVA